MESNRVIAGTIGLFVVICLVGAVLAPMINDWATGEKITNEGAGWLRMDYTEVTESSNYSMAVSIAGGTITVTDTNSATQSGADDTIAYASSNLAIWTDSGTIQILGTDPDGDPYYATASASVNVWYNQVLGQIIKIDGSEDAITFAAPTWAYLPLTNGNYAFFDNGTSVQTEEGKPLAAVGGGFAGVYAYNNIVCYDIPLEIQTTQDADGLLNGAYWAELQQDQRQLNPIILDPLDPNTRTDPDSGGSFRYVPTPTYTDGDWGYDTTTVDDVTKAVIVSYTGSSSNIVIPSTIGGYDVYRVGATAPTTSGSRQIFNNTDISSGTTISFPDGLVQIGSGVFYGMTNLGGTLTIPDSVTEIGQAAFSGCTGLSGTLTLPSNLNFIGEDAFKSCSGLTGPLTIPDSVTELNTGTFSGCTGLSGTLTLPSSLTKIKSTVFNNCSGLTGTIILSDTLTQWQGTAFSRTQFTDLVILTDVTPIANFNNTVFDQVLNLSSVDYDNNRYGLPVDATVQDNIGDALGYISFVEKGSDPLVPAGAAAVMLAIPVVILGALIVVAATTFIRKE